ncbi:protein unc-13 homolog [Cornus florida]|uniref:protein unc-13 homolog n=1 Tax=Cornus florida TaxID=4283 RepID=UPI002896DD1D|nr:protein unc-13 homolog [Cornus florida]
MAHYTRRHSLPAVSILPSRPDPVAAPGPVATELAWPFGELEGVEADDIRETAYEIFFTACRSSPGFGGRNTLTYYSSSEGGGDGWVSGFGSGQGSPGKSGLVGVSTTSKVKRFLGLKTIRRSMSKRTISSPGSNPSSPVKHGVSSPGSNPSSPRVSSPGSSPRMAWTTPQGRPRKPKTAAEIMRQQMRVSEESDNRLRKTLMRTLVGQMGRRPETIILPLELLRHLKIAEFNDSREYHVWQQRQLKILEAGLILYPSIPLEKSNTFAKRFREIARACEAKAIDTGKNSESMKTLCNCVVSLSWRSPNGSTTDVCHWADGFPLNVHLYIALLHSIFDLKEESLVLDEIDEMMELMKKTWSTLGINRSIHQVCFSWVLFQQYIATGQVETDLLSATLAMLSEVAKDAKRADQEPIYVKMLSLALLSMKNWSEKRLLDYHGCFQKKTIGIMENLLPLVFSATKILEEDVSGVGAAELEKGEVVAETTGCRVDQYIRSSLRNAFTKMLENGNISGMLVEVPEVNEALLQLAKDTEVLALKEKEIFSSVLRKWHPIAAGVAAATLHTCYGTLLKQYLAGVTSLTNETIMVLQRAGKLEKILVQMVVEDTVECEDGGKTIVREMVPYEVDLIILNILKQWIQERLKKGKECLQREKETETWNPKSKTEPYAQSAVELMKYVKEIVDDLFEISDGISDELVCDLADGIEHLIRDYTTFVASCGSKQSYVPALPPLTRCNRDSRFIKLWKKASPCKVTVNLDDSHQLLFNDGQQQRPSTSRGTQRLYIRLNTLYYLLSQLHSLDKTLSLSPHIIQSPSGRFSNNHGQLGSYYSYFDHARLAIQESSQHVSEVAAYRLIFLDSNPVFYEGLYVGDVENARIKPALQILKQNLTLLSAIVTDRAQPLAMKEVMKASFEAYLMILLAGGSSRMFCRSDHEMIEEDFDSLKQVFSKCGEGLIPEDVMEREVDTVEGVVALMGQPTEQLVEDFSIVVCEASGMGTIGAGQKLPMPPTTGRWNRSDPNTILRVLCHRNDRLANQFLKRTFQLAKRR